MAHPVYTCIAIQPPKPKVTHIQYISGTTTDRVEISTKKFGIFGKGEVGKRV